MMVRNHNYRAKSNTIILRWRVIVMLLSRTQLLNIPIIFYWEATSMNSDLDSADQQINERVAMKLIGTNLDDG